jgi:hypothetical protein
VRNAFPPRRSSALVHALCTGCRACWCPRTIYRLHSLLVSTHYIQAAKLAGVHALYTGCTACWCPRTIYRLHSLLVSTHYIQAAKLAGVHALYTGYTACWCPRTIYRLHSLLVSTHYIQGCSHMVTVFPYTDAGSNTAACWVWNGSLRHVSQTNRSGWFRLRFSSRNIRLTSTGCPYTEAQLHYSQGRGGHCSSQQLCTHRRHIFNPNSHAVQTSSGAQPASYPVGTDGSFSGDEVAGA